MATQTIKKGVESKQHGNKLLNHNKKLQKSKT